MNSGDVKCLPLWVAQMGAAVGKYDHRDKRACPSQISRCLPTLHFSPPRLLILDAPYSFVPGLYCFFGLKCLPHDLFHQWKASFIIYRVWWGVFTLECKVLRTETDSSSSPPPPHVGSGWVLGSVGVSGCLPTLSWKLRLSWSWELWALVPAQPWTCDPRYSIWVLQTL